MATVGQEENVNINATIIQYESFINDVLKDHLRKIIDRRDCIYSKIAEYLQLKRIIEQIVQGNRKAKKQYKVLTEIGCNFYCQAEVCHASNVVICVGLDTFVEFTPSEGIEFISKKVNVLTKQAENLSSESARIKAFIKLILSGLRDLQLLQFNEPSGQKEIGF